MRHFPSISGAASLLLVLASEVQAYTRFETKCSTPTETVNFVTSPDSRGTLDILWSCLFTLFACTWTIQHLNVPEQRDGRDPGYWGDIKWKLKSFWKSIKWMLINIIAPEIILGKAYGDFMVARKSSKKMTRFAAEDGVDWSLAHSFYANMGGFILHHSVEEQINDKSAVHGLGQVLQTQRDGEAPAESHVSTTQPVQPLCPTSNDIYTLREKGILKKLPDISTEELNDKSKGDSFVKVVAVGQVFWIIFQVIVRVAKGLSISQLELAVTAFSVCAIATYILLLHKPQNVHTPSRPISCGNIGSEIQTTELLLFRFLLGRPGVVQTPITRTYLAIPNDSFPVDSTAGITGIVIGGAIFGSIHVAGWNLDTPTPIEQTLWRISSIILTASFTANFGFVWLLSNVFQYPGRVAEWVLHTYVLFHLVLYIAARLFILVEIVRCLCYSPPDLYVSTWASNVPHV